MSYPDKRDCGVSQRANKDILRDIDKVFLLFLNTKTCKYCKNWKELARIIHLLINKIMKYIKKAVVIDAIQVKANNFDRICDFMGCTPEQVLNPMSDIDEFGDSRDPYLGVIIDTLEGKMQANIGDMIIKGVKGEFYPCKPDIFKATYDKAPADYKDRMRVEYYDLNERWNKLGAFFQTAAYGNLNDKQKALLEAQHKAMAEYRKVLEERIKLEGIVL